MIPQEYLPMYLTANVVGLVLLEMGYWFPHVTRWAWIGIFVWAASVNTVTVATEPWAYLAYGGLTPSAWYREFINGWFGQHIPAFVGAIAVGQLAIAILLSRDRRSRRLGVIGAVVFLLAIAPLGVGSGFPFSLSAIGSLLLMDQRLRALRASSPAARFVPNPDASDEHEIRIHAPSHIVFERALHIDAGALPLVRAIFWLRSKIMRDTPVARVPQGFVAEAKSLGYGVLVYEPDRVLVMGAVACPWQKNVTFRAIAPESFVSFGEPNLVKIVWTLEVEPLGAVMTRLRTETRAQATDTRARRKFTLYWLAFSIGIHFIRWSMLRAIRREAESAAAMASAA